MVTMDKTIIGLTEEIRINGNMSDEAVIARIDTGATKSSIDLTLAAKLMLGPVIESKLIKSAHGSKLRPVIEADIIIKDKKISAHFTLADRSHMKYPMLIGQNILREGGFLIDPTLK
jgi:hypothetical protein